MSPSSPKNAKITRDYYLCKYCHNITVFSHHSLRQRTCAHCKLPFKAKKIKNNNFQPIASIEVKKVSNDKILKTQEGKLLNIDTSEKEKKSFIDQIIEMKYAIPLWLLLIFGFYVGYVYIWNYTQTTKLNAITNINKEEKKNANLTRVFYNPNILPIKDYAKTAQSALYNFLLSETPLDKIRSSAHFEQSQNNISAYYKNHSLEQWQKPIKLFKADLVALPNGKASLQTIWCAGEGENETYYEVSFRNDNNTVLWTVDWQEYTREQPKDWKKFISTSNSDEGTFRVWVYRSTLDETGEHEHDYALKLYGASQNGSFTPNSGSRLIYVKKDSDLGHRFNTLFSNDLRENKKDRIVGLFDANDIIRAQVKLIKEHVEGKVFPRIIIDNLVCEGWSSFNTEKQLSN